VVGNVWTVEVELDESKLAKSWIEMKLAGKPPVSSELYLLSPENWLAEAKSIR
jgi:hypothetical protein